MVRTQLYMIVIFVFAFLLVISVQLELVLCVHPPGNSKVLDGEILPYPCFIALLCLSSPGDMRREMKIMGQ